MTEYLSLITDNNNNYSGNSLTPFFPNTTFRKIDLFPSSSGKGGVC